VLKVAIPAVNIMAAPATYAVNGVQYVDVRGVVVMGAKASPRVRRAEQREREVFENTNRIHAFKLGGGP